MEMGLIHILAPDSQYVQKMYEEVTFLLCGVDLKTVSGHVIHMVFTHIPMQKTWWNMNENNPQGMC